jgi:tRNA pseudouridine-54 N-methylase
MSSSKKKVVTFLLVLEEELPDVNFSLKNLRGSSKIDVVARNILASFPSFSNFEVNYIVLFTKNNPTALIVTDLAKREKPYDEIEIASLIKTSLQDSYNQNAKTNSSEDLSLQFFNWQHLKEVQSFFTQIKNTNEHVFYLHENGQPFNDIVQDIQIANSLCFIFGGRHDISEEMEKAVLKITSAQVSLGKRSYLASTCIVFVLFELEKLEIN